MVPFLSWHVEVHYFVLVRVVDVESCLQQSSVSAGTYLDVELAALFVFDHSAKSVANGVQECGLAHAGVAHQRNLKSEMVVVVLLELGQAACILLKAQWCRHFVVVGQLHVLLASRHHVVLLDSVLTKTALVDSGRQQ